MLWALLVKIMVSWMHIEVLEVLWVLLLRIVAPWMNAEILASVVGTSTENGGVVNARGSTGECCGHCK